MLTPEYMKNAPVEIVSLFEQMEEDIIKDISRRIAKNLELTETADYQIKILSEMGYDLNEIKKEISKTMDKSLVELEEILEDASLESYHNDMELYKIGGKVLPPIDNNPKMKDFVESTIKNAKKDITNLTNTTGFVYNGEFNLLDKFYKDTLNQAMLQVGSGAFDYNTVLRQAVKKLGDSGIRTIDYSSGRAYHIESAVRMNVLTALGQITNGMSFMNIEMMGAEFVEVSSHMGARPSHQDFQGNVYAINGPRDGYEDFETETGYGTIEGLGGINCRHSFFPFFPGISERAYTDKQLKEIDPEPFEYDGRTYTAYEASQKQRQIERSMRQTKRQIKAYDGAGLKDDFTAASIKLRRQKELYKDFSNAANLREKVERTGTYGYNKSISSKSVWADRKVKEKANSLYDIGSTKTNVDAYLRDKPLRDKILSSDTIKTIHEGRQGKHILGHNNYIEGRSYMSITLEEMQQIVNIFAGTGHILRDNKGKWNNKELIEVSKVLGVTFDIEGKARETNKGIIHYSKKGTHVVPTLREVRK